MVKEEGVSKKLAKFKVPLKKAIHYYLLITKPIHKLPDKRIELLTEISPLVCDWEFIGAIFKPMDTDITAVL